MVFEEIKGVEKEMRELYRLQEISAWKRYRFFYLRDGERNICYFYVKAFNRRKRNKIEKLKDEMEWREKNRSRSTMW